MSCPILERSIAKSGLAEKSSVCAVPRKRNWLRSGRDLATRCSGAFDCRRTTRSSGPARGGSTTTPSYPAALCAMRSIRTGYRWPNTAPNSNMRTRSCSRSMTEEIRERPHHSSRRTPALQLHGRANKLSLRLCGHSGCQAVSRRSGQARIQPSVACTHAADWRLRQHRAVPRSVGTHCQSFQLEST